MPARHKQPHTGCPHTHCTAVRRCIPETTEHKLTSSQLGRHLNKRTCHQAQSIYYPMISVFIKAAGPQTQNLSPRKKGAPPQAPKKRLSNYARSFEGEPFSNKQLHPAFRENSHPHHPRVRFCYPFHQLPQLVILTPRQVPRGRQGAGDERQLARGNSTRRRRRRSALRMPWMARPCLSAPCLF